MIDYPLNFNYRRQNMFQTRQTREKHMKTSDTADANLCLKFNTLLFGDLVTHVNHWRHVHKAPLYFSSTVFAISQVSKTVDIRSSDRTVCIHKGLNLTSLRNL